jgi:hypothetical protein
MIKFTVASGGNGQTESSAGEVRVDGRPTCVVTPSREAFELDRLDCRGHASTRLWTHCQRQLFRNSKKVEATNKTPRPMTTARLIFTLILIFSFNSQVQGQIARTKSENEE